MKYTITSKEIWNSFDSLLLETRYVCRSSLLNIGLRPYKILQLLFQEGPRLRAESAFSFFCHFQKVVCLQSFLIHTLLSALWTLGNACGAEGFRLWVCSRIIFPPQRGGTTAAFLGPWNTDNTFVGGDLRLQIVIDVSGVSPYLN